MTQPDLSPKAARHRARKTQEEASREADISLDTIRKIEQRSGRGEPVRVQRRTWEKLCAVYGVESLAGVELRP